MRVTTPEFERIVKHHLVPERFIQPFPHQERRWVRVEEQIIGIKDPTDAAETQPAVDYLVKYAEAHPGYWGDWRIVLVTSDVTTQVVP